MMSEEIGLALGALILFALTTIAIVAIVCWTIIRVWG